MFKGSWRWSLPCLAFVVIPVTSMLCVGALFIGPIIWHDLFRESFDDFLIKFLGLGCTADYTLSEEDARRLEEAGYDPDIVANAASAIPWIRGATGRTCDIGILISIYQLETANGTNYGGCSFIPSPGSPAAWLLDRFEQFDIRSKNPVAAEYIKADYSGYKGHCASEMGVGFWPPTGKAICEKYLANDGDREVASCDYWLPKTFMRAEGATITASPYKYEASMSDEEKVEALYGWNHILSYRQLLVRRANDINEIVGDVTVTRKARSWPFFDFIRKDWVIPILDAIGILPEVQKWRETPLPKLYPKRIMFDFHEVDEKTGRKHFAVDWACITGTPILAIANGVVITPRHGSLMDRIKFDLGNNVWLVHDGGIYSVYGHLSAVFVSGGQEVRQDDVIGLCGSTGAKSTGSHIHLGISDQHPDDFVLWGEEEPGWRNPHEFLGTCGVLGE